MLLLGVALLGLLVASVLGARALVDAPVVVPPAPALPPPPVSAPTRVPPPTTPVARVAEAPVAVAPAPAPLPTPAPVPETTVMLQPPVDMPEARDELPHDKPVEEALLMMTGGTPTVEQAREAAQVFAECLRRRPQDYRCSTGLKLAREKQVPRPPLVPFRKPMTPRPEPEAVEQ